MTMYDHSFPLAESAPNNSIIITEAQSLYDLGLNVLPVIHGCKKPYGEHGFLTTTRLYRPWLPALFADSNLAVVTGRLSGNLVILDCDSLETFAQIGNALATRDIQPWTRNGVDGGQYWLSCAEGELANTKIGELDVLGNGTYTLAPPSLHPDGINYCWLKRISPLPPVVSLAQLDFLQLRMASIQHPSQEQSHILPLVADRVLIQQDISGYASNSEAEYAACMSLLAAGRSDPDILGLFEVFSPPHYEKVGNRRFGQYVLNSARAYIERADQVTARSGITHSSSYVQWAQCQPWPGRTGATDRAVFLALCERMKMERGMPFRASIREVAELAGVNKETAMKALRRLTELGFVRHSHSLHKGHSGASHYRLVLPTEVITTRTVGVTYTPVGVNVRSSNTGHDVWHSRALGKSAQSCWAALYEAGTLTVAELATWTGRTPPTIRRVLARLAEFGLAQTDNKNWQVLDVASDALDRIALELGTSGKGEARTERHQEERQKWASSRILEQERRWQESHQRFARP